MSYNMDDVIHRCATSFVLLIVLISFPVSRGTNNSTVCYGTIGPPCTTHRLSCPSPLVIQIINTTYGYRPGCNYNGISDCTDTTCCNEEPGDCFEPFSVDHHQRVLRNCGGEENCTVYGFRNSSNVCVGINQSAYSKIQFECVSNGKYDQQVEENCLGKQSCFVSGFRGFGAECGRTISVYGKIEYDCVSNGMTTINHTTIKSTTEVTQSPKENIPTTQYSTDLTVSTTSTTQCLQCSVTQNDNTGIVGGVFGTLLIISVCVNVGLVVYFTRKIKTLSSTPRENNYDGLTNTGRDQPLPTYDDLQVQSTASSNHDDKKKSDRPNSHTYYNTKGDSLSRNIDPYYENMKKP